jgi:hypothetical protein
MKKERQEYQATSSGNEDSCTYLEGCCDASECGNRNPWIDDMRLQGLRKTAQSTKPRIWGASSRSRMRG